MSRTAELAVSQSPERCSQKVLMFVLMLMWTVGAKHYLKDHCLGQAETLRPCAVGVQSDLWWGYTGSTEAVKSGPAAGNQHWHLIAILVAELGDITNGIHLSCHIRAHVLQMPKEAGVWDREVQQKIRLWWYSPCLQQSEASVDGLPSPSGCDVMFCQKAEMYYSCPHAVLVVNS